MLSVMLKLSHGCCWRKSFPVREHELLKPGPSVFTNADPQSCFSNAIFAI